jgi:hypothetical protein
VAWSKLLVDESFDKKDRDKGLEGERSEDADAVLRGLVGTRKHFGGGTACKGPGGLWISLGPLGNGVEGTTGMVPPIAQTHDRHLPFQVS